MDLIKFKREGSFAFVLSGAILFLIGLVWFLLDDPGGYEVGILEWFESIRDPFVNNIVIGFTLLGNVSVIIPLTLAFMVVLMVVRKPGLSLRVMIIGISLLIVNFILKITFARERPDEVLHLVEETSYSFPSGHSMVSNSIYGLIFLVLGSSRKNGYSIFIPIWFIFSLLMGISRIYVGIHYPSDVLAGLGICFIVFPLLFLIVERYQEKKRNARVAIIG